MLLELKLLEALSIGSWFSAALDSFLRSSWYSTLVQVEDVPQAAFLGFLLAYGRALRGRLYALLLRTLVSAVDFLRRPFCTMSLRPCHNV